MSSSFRRRPLEVNGYLDRVCHLRTGRASPNRPDATLLSPIRKQRAPERSNLTGTGPIHSTGHTTRVWSPRLRLPVRYVAIDGR